MIYGMLLLLSIILRTTAKIIDLSHNHGPNTIMSPHAPHFNRSTIFSGEYLPGIYIEGGQYFSGEHGGTHMDAPLHFVKDGQAVHEIPLVNTIAEGVMIDCSEEAATDKSYLVPLQKILDWEMEYGEIPKDAAVLFNFGWSSKFHDRKLYLGTESNDQFTYVFPAISPETGLWLYDNRQIKIIGSDTMSPDPFTINGNKATDIPIHRKYLINERLIFENLNSLDMLPPRGFRFHASPVKYVGSTGTQVRAYAMTFDEDNSFSAAGRLAGRSSLLVLFIIISVFM